MSRLADFLREPVSPPATPATSATNEIESSRSSESSSPAESDSEMRAVASPVVRCMDCLHFKSRHGEQPDGHCLRFDTQAWSAVEFSCQGFDHRNRVARARAREVKTAFYKE